MSAIKWLTCPKCANRFYIMAEHAGQAYEWFCPGCKHRFVEEESADVANRRSDARARS